MVWFKHKVAEEAVGFKKDKDGFYVEAGEQLNGGPEFKDFIKGLDNYKYTPMGTGVYLGTAMMCDTVMRCNTIV